MGDFGELLNLIELRSNPKHPYDAGQRNGKLAFRALGFLGGAGIAGLAARAPKLFKLLTGRRKPRAASNVVASRGLSQIDEFVDLTKHRRDHILNRHRAGAGKPGKTEFPRDWSDERILHQVSDVATDPNAVRGVGKHNIPYAIATRDGIEIRVDFYAHDHPRFAGQISTAYPTNVPANP